MMTQTAPIEASLAEVRWLQHFAQLLARNAGDVDDLVQDTLITAWTDPPTRAQPVRPWLATVLRNRWRMTRRSAARRKRREDMHASGAAVHPEAGPEQALIRIRVLRELTAGLEGLPIDDQRLIVRRFVHGQTGAEIARDLNLSAGTVRSRISRALARLRDRLDDRFDDRSIWCAAVVGLPGPAATGGPTHAAGSSTATLTTACVAVAIVGGAVGWLAFGDPRTQIAEPAIAVAVAAPRPADDSPAANADGAGDRRDWTTRRIAIRERVAAQPEGPGDGAATEPAGPQARLEYAALVSACLEDLEDVPTVLGLEITEVGAPDLGTIVEAVEILQISLENPAVDECIEQSMFAYVGAAPAVPYEETQIYAFALPGSERSEPEDSLARGFSEAMKAHAGTASDCVEDSATGSVEIKVGFGKDGAPTLIAITDSSMDETVGGCIAQSVMPMKFAPTLAGHTLVYRYEFPTDGDS